MSALSIQPTYPIFTDIDGQPLEAGYVWIGTANLDPQTNPINVYWDDALTILAPQPIRTLAGYPSRNGTPARLYVNSDYSIRVMNRNGSTVYSAPEATERVSGVVISGDISSTDVLFTQNGNGAVTQTVQNKLRLAEVSVKDFGAVGDGIADDGPAIQAAIDYCGGAYPVGAAPTLGYARATLVFPPGVYLTRQTLNFLPFINYVGTRATTVDANANTADQSDSRGSIIRADVSIYNAGSNPTGCLVYISTGDIFIRGLQFVGTAQINGNPSTGIQFGSHGGVATTGRSYETDGTGQNTSGVNVEECTFYTFSNAWECNMLNDAFMYQCRFESNTTSISFTQNVVAPINQSCEFIGCAIFGYAVGVGFDSGPAYTVTFNGGYFFGTSNSSQSVAYSGNAGSMNLKFNGVNFDHLGTGCAHFLMNGDYDGMFNRLLVTGCVFNGGASRSKIQLSRGAGTAVYNHAIFSSCQYLATYFQLDLATKIQIKDSYFYDGYITMANATACDIAGNEFFAYNGTGITFSTANCVENAVRFNRFTNVTTPISVFDNPTNDSSVFQDNFGITAAPTRGKFLDYINNITFANLGTPANGSMVYCADGTIANPVAGGGTGCIAKRLNGVWVGN